MFKDNGLDVIIMAVIAVVITSLIKKPIKNKTSKMNEPKRKAINTLIILIPLGIAIIECVVFYGVILKTWSFVFLLEVVFSVFVMSLSMNEIFSRLYSIIKSFRSGDMSLVKESFEAFSEDLKVLIRQAKDTEKEIIKTNSQIEKARTIKESTVSNNDGIKISLFASTNEELKLLKNKENVLKQKFNDLKLQISKFNKNLSV